MDVKKVFFSGLLLVGLSARSEDQLVSLINVGLKNSVIIETDKINLEKSENIKWKGYANLLPTLSASMARSYARSRDYNSDGIKVLSKSQSDGLTVDASWTIWDNFNNVNNIRSNQINHRIQEIKTDLERQKYIKKIIEDYFDLQELYYRKISTDELYDQAIKAKEEAQYLIKVGQKTKFEAVDADIDVVSAERDLMEIKNDIEVAELNLSYELNVKDKFQLEHIELISYRPFFIDHFEEQFEKYEAAWEKLCDQHNDDLKISKLEFEKSSIDLFNEKLNYFPKLALYASSSFDFSYKTKKNPEPYETSPKENYALGISATWTLFDFGATYKMVQNSKLDFKMAEINFKDQRYRSETEIQNYLKQYKINLKSIAASQLMLEKARQNYDYNSYMYKLGKINLMTRQRAMTQLHSAKLDLASRLKSKYSLAMNLMLRLGDKIY